MKHFILSFEFGPNLMEERKPYRAAHLDYLNLYVERGAVVMGGALADNSKGVVIFKAENAEEVEAIADADPYVIHNVAKSYRVIEWVTVLGKDALNKVVLV
jgi:uncharacterized protein YciI